MKIKILVTGSNGQLGFEIKKSSSLYTEFDFFFTDKITLDITKFDVVNDYIIDNQINVILNCAAYTDVNKAENDTELADSINHRSVENLAYVSKKNNIKLIHISTDYVFNGQNYKPYLESDQVEPNSIYGESKANGEKAFIKISPKNSIIIRTSWVYSSHGNNFVKSILRLAKERKELNIVYDQVGTPTYANDLAKVILDIINKINNDKVEIYNYSNEGVLSWYDFAKNIMEITNTDCKILPIESKDYPMSDIRPFYSLLNKAKIKNTFDLDIPYYKDSLKECLKLMGDN